MRHIPHVIMKYSVKYLCGIIYFQKKYFSVYNNNSKKNQIFKYTGIILKCVICISIITTKTVNAEYGNSTVTTSNDFITRCRRDCVIKRDVVVCGKYRIAKWLNEVMREKEFSYGPLKFTTIPAMTQDEILPKWYKSRNVKTFAMEETVNFIRDLAEDTIKRRALVYTYEPETMTQKSFGTGLMILDEDELVQVQRGQSDEPRIFKKKKAIIIPILILLNLVKIKLLLLPILLGVHLIKKLIVIGGLFVPGILSKLRICKVPHYPPYHSWATAAEAPVDYPTAYSHDDPGWAHKNDLISGIGYRGPYHSYHAIPPYYQQR